ncbi:tryptophan synthase subunit alpha [Methanogenium marinum]|uniref:Tryptophan synthase alpha chain n=1 Tax=Methanogenium marinum TaxID=348610 RepID=A0A9Q4KSW8_9EURY|nr:tryptophan synthase subunit alpha [Methanogenium marinum]MDE4907994.1 tryptophan synthase subunit alpha [Methanogenium marinum]
MNRFETVFERPAFIAFTVAGDPDLTTSLAVAQTIIHSGADILELGIPFSDPVGDGPVIQRADERALSAGATTDSAFALVREIRKTSEVPVVLLVYCNTVYSRGPARFYKDAKAAGVDGILIVDMPVEEGHLVMQYATESGIAPIFTVTPTTPPERVKKITDLAGGFLYLVSLSGVTGRRETLSEAAVPLIQRVRKETSLPLALGFGIATETHARQAVEAGADGVIVGSAIVEIVERHVGDLAGMERELSDYIARMKAAVVGSVPVDEDQNYV